MTDLSDLLTPDAIVAGLSAGNKKTLFHQLGQIAARAYGLDPRAVAEPVDFAAVDELPVDLVFMMLSPVGAGAEHLKALARVSRRLRDRGFAAKLRGAGSPDALYALLTGVEARDAA